MTRATMNKALDFLIEKAIEEIKAQGHVASGQGIESFEKKIYFSPQGEMVGEVWANDYLVTYVRTGTRPHWVPIKVLINWVKLIDPGLSQEETVSFAYAVQHTIAKEGTPTRGAYNHTENGRRKEWTEFGLQAAEAGIEDLFENDRNLIQIYDKAFFEAL
jgi:hypothetical protein